MAMDAAPAEPPRQEIHAAACQSSFKAEEVSKIFKDLQQKMPKTQFTEAWASCMPGLVAVKLANGTVAYTDRTARYLIIGIVLDTTTGRALDKQLEGVSP